jgi:hypothetical protein
MAIAAATAAAIPIVILILISLPSPLFSFFSIASYFKKHVRYVISEIMLAFFTEKFSSDRATFMFFTL